ncbi:hydantoinase B/oxoprolinase family protein [Patulibacter defluvii]|uniref:hydantoinase B/oxoprolinase family protein n=1 Tax=Patulibacter defluvii TaxID=3095358 RepID=UPI002A757ADB|nr:hydantoinase B/oxoprolinase family protein [Patulibacter sp. DM4]
MAPATTTPSTTLDPVTFEVLKNSFVTLVDEMAEQILRTCHSFVIYARDFSCALCDAEGNTIMQGSQDIAVHVGTLHLKAKAVLEDFDGDINEGDVFAVNDPYRGGTHFSDVSVIRPIFADGELVAMAQANGHWADMGGSVPGSFDVSATDHFGEGVRIPPVRIVDRGVVRHDVIGLVAHNTRAPGDIVGDCHAQIEATRVAEQEVFRLVDKYGSRTVTTAFGAVQDYVERLTRARIADLPDGVWETEDHLDLDPGSDEGLVAVRLKMTIEGDEIHYDLSGSDPAISSFLNSGAGVAFSGAIASAKTFLPDIPLNSGFYRAVKVDVGPEGTVVNAGWPNAVTGCVSGAYEKIMSAGFELWSQLMPERALACCFNLEYLLVGGRDARRDDRPFFMWYDWMAGGWGGRHGKDGQNATSPVFGVGLAVQPLEGQERLTPVLTSVHEIIPDSGGPGRHRGGCGVRKGGTLTDVEHSVMSYCCDRGRAVTWGIGGGMPSLPHGVWLNRGSDRERYLGANFSGVAVERGDRFERPSAGGGGLGDPLERDPAEVLEDVIDGYVTLGRAERDYGVVVREIDAELSQYEVDAEATERARAEQRVERVGWLDEDPEEIATRFRNGELDVLDLVRRHGVILDWGSGELLPRTTEQYRSLLRRRSAAQWSTP